MFMKQVDGCLIVVSLVTTAWVAGGASAWAQNVPTDTLSNGVKIQHVVVGTGAQPKPLETVKVHYRGTLADGKEFDSSYKRHAPASFALHRVIPCWSEGLQKLKVGGKAILTCPGASAYGERGVPGTIPPNATLTFEVELLGIGS
jgi:FKBP-type peptidyl-prolyl cis-trans isomerase FkpA